MAAYLAMRVCGNAAMCAAVQAAALRVDKERAKRRYRGRITFAEENFY